MDKQNKSAEEEQLIRDLIDKFMNFKSGAESASIQHYAEYGAVSGSLFLNVKAMMKEFSNSQLTTLQQANEELEKVVSERVAECIGSGMKIVELEKQNAEYMRQLEKCLEVLRGHGIAHNLRDELHVLIQSHESNKQP